jgi:hypothetical protein
MDPNNDALWTSQDYILTYLGSLRMLHMPRNLAGYHPADVTAKELRASINLLARASPAHRETPKEVS